MKFKVLGVDNIKEFGSLPERLDIHIKYPGYNDILHLISKEKIKIICQKQRDNCKKFTLN
ncbi:MAG: hypothetical protein N4A72_15020 [Bacteroidales bacterium]|jgi:hypothetical protein|nr:hypothetical protein [Bacteroidales bacterium]